MTGASDPRLRESSPFGGRFGLGPERRRLRRRTAAPPDPHPHRSSRREERESYGEVISTRHRLNGAQASRKGAARRHSTSAPPPPQAYLKRSRPVRSRRRPAAAASAPRVGGRRAGRGDALAVGDRLGPEAVAEAERHSGAEPCRRHASCRQCARPAARTCSRSATAGRLLRTARPHGLCASASSCSLELPHDRPASPVAFLSGL